MSITKTFDFSVPGDYTYDSSKIYVNSSQATLKLSDNPEQIFPITFASDVGFVYDNTKAEFVGGKLQQKDQRPSTAICGATYTDSLNLSWGADAFISLAHTAIGSPVLNSGKVNCPDGNNGLYYSDALIGNLGNTGTIKVKYTPNYSVAPSTNAGIIALRQGETTTDEIVISNSPSGNNLRITTPTLAAVVLGAWNPVAGQEYVFELQWGAGLIRLFIDGVQIGTDKVLASRGTGATRLYLGSGAIYPYANGQFNDLEVFTDLQQNASYTVPEKSYASTIITTPELSYTGAGTLVSFDEFTTTESGSPKFTIQIGRSGDYLYWNGSSWAISDGTYNQATGSILFNSNCPNLPVIGEIYGQYKIFFEESNIQSCLENVTSMLTAQIYSTDCPTIKNTDVIKTQGITSIAIVDTGDTVFSIKYTIEVDGIEKYWNGSSWAISEGFVESNSSEQIESNISTLNLSSGSDIRFVAYLCSTNGASTPVLSSIEIIYDFYGGTAIKPDLCVVWGHIHDITDEASENVTVQVQSENVSGYQDEILVTTTPKTITPDSTGYWEVSLFASEDLSPVTNYNFLFSGVKFSLYKTKIIPQEPSKNFLKLEDE